MRKNILLAMATTTALLAVRAAEAAPTGAYLGAGLEFNQIVGKGDFANSQSAIATDSMLTANVSYSFD